MVTRDASLLAALALSLCNPQIATAQVSLQGNVTHGTFGNRTLGQPFVPRPGTFGGGIQTGPAGNFLFLGRPDGSAAFATPWRQFDATTIEQAAAARPTTQPAPTTAAPPPASTAENRVPELSAVPGPALPLLSETNGQEGMAPVAGPLLASQVTLPHVGSLAAPASQHGEQPYARSAALSETLTRIARANGMLAGPGIDVYLSSNTARLEGTVHSPADGARLSRVLALEPGVRQIDNRLVVEAARRPSAH